MNKAPIPEQGTKRILCCIYLIRAPSVSTSASHSFFIDDFTDMYRMRPEHKCQQGKEGYLPAAFQNFGNIFRFHLESAYTIIDVIFTINYA
jgi:hypothetical protein